MTTDLPSTNNNKTNKRAASGVAQSNNDTADLNRYQEHTESSAELERALKTVPVKDYSDYEITLEQKSDYEDAIFANEEELNDALTLSKTDTPKQHLSTDKPKPALTADSVEKIDYSVFTNKLGVVTNQKTELDPDTRKISILENTLNDSPARKMIANNALAIEFKAKCEEIAQQIEEDNKQLESLGEEDTTPPESSDASNDKVSVFTQLVKKQSAKLTQLGKQKLEKSKTEFDEYLGRNLPERTFDLEFIFPNIKGKEDPQAVLKASEVEKLFSVKGKTLATIFSKSSLQLTALSKTDIPDNKRIALLNIYYSNITLKIKSLISMFERKPVAFDDSKRTAMIDESINIIKQMIYGYKFVYHELYQSNNFTYGHQRELANSLAFTLFDCLFLEQQLLTALHVSPPPASTKTINKLFFALAEYETEFLDEPCYAYADEQETTISSLFKRYQLLQFIDFKSLSSSLHKDVQNYLFRHSEKLRFILPEISKDLGAIPPGQQMLSINHDTNSTATLLTQEKPLEISSPIAPVYLPIQNLLNQIKKDYVNGLKLRVNFHNEHRSKLFQDLSLENYLLALGALNRSVRNTEANWSAHKYTLYNPVSLKAYSGFESCLQFLEHNHAKAEKGELTAGQPTNELPALPSGSKCQWLCASEDSESLYLETIEHSIGIPIDIGELVIFVKIPSKDHQQKKDTAETPTPEESYILTRITRLERDHQCKLHVVATKLSDQFCQIGFSTNEDSKGIMLLRESHSMLIIDNALRAGSDAVLPMVFPDQTTAACRVGSLTALSNSFQIISIS